MKPLVIILSLAVSGIALSSTSTTALASKMNGKCCQSSDGGRSYVTAARNWSDVS